MPSMGNEETKILASTICEYLNNEILSASAIDPMDRQRFHPGYHLGLHLIYIYPHCRTILQVYDSLVTTVNHEVIAECTNPDFLALIAAEVRTILQKFGYSLNSSVRTY